MSATATALTKPVEKKDFYLLLAEAGLCRKCKKVYTYCRCPFGTWKGEKRLNLADRH